MLQYLLNATAIWLISLLSYDIFLRKTTRSTKQIARASTKNSNL
jgi:hypothetical protein